MSSKKSKLNQIIDTLCEGKDEDYKAFIKKMMLSMNEVGFYKNVKDLGNKIEYLLKYPKKINEYGKRGKEKYFKLFNNKIITKKIIEKTF